MHRTAGTRPRRPARSARDDSQPTSGPSDGRSVRHRRTVSPRSHYLPPANRASCLPRPTATRIRSIPDSLGSCGNECLDGPTPRATPSSRPIGENHGTLSFRWAEPPSSAWCLNGPALTPRVSWRQTGIRRHLTDAGWMCSGTISCCRVAQSGLALLLGKEHRPAV